MSLKNVEYVFTTKTNISFAKFSSIWGVQSFLLFRRFYKDMESNVKNDNCPGDKELVQALILDAQITKVFEEKTSRRDS